MKAAAASPDFLAERRWVPKGVRYGDLQEVGQEVAAEVSAAYDEERLAHLLEQALRQTPGQVTPAEPLPPEVVAERLHDPDWKKRYAALEQLEPEPSALAVVISALSDANPSVRRLATVYLGQIGEGVLPHLIRMLRDDSPAVRRAAGDCLSDLGDPAAIGPMCEALQDKSKLVRWRAARYLYEVGDESALPALRKAAADPEFEVRLQAQMAIERIEGGRNAVEPAWKQLTRLWDEPER
jgi:HEAT repeat protein